jgi:hypothetical protein
MPRFATIVPILAAALLIAACGSSSPSSSPGSSGPVSQASAQAAGLKFASCMRANGVPNFPDPTDGSDGVRIQASQKQGSGQTMTVNGVPVSAPAFQSANTKCQKDLPKGLSLSPAQVSNLRKAALRMADCMRSHGVPNFPDPSVQSGPNGGIGIKLGGPGSGINPQSPAFQAAQKLCQPILQSAGGPGGLPPKS